MNLMGKIFTFLIFLMSTVFLIVAIMVGASDRNWKTLAQDMKTRAATATNSIDSLKDERARLEKDLVYEKTSRQQQLSNLQTQVRLAQSSLTDKSTQFNEEQKISQGIARELEEANRRLAAQDTELATIKANNTKLVDDIATQFTENRNIEKRLFAQTAKLEQLLQTEADMAAKLARITKVMKANGLDENSLTASIAPKIEAVVTSVGERGEQFGIMVGRDDGLRKGHQMDIYRTGRYVGAGVIISADNNHSVLSMIEGLRNGNVREGDNVKTRIF